MEIIAGGEIIALILIYRAINWFIAYRDRPTLTYLTEEAALTLVKAEHLATQTMILTTPTTSATL